MIYLDNAATSFPKPKKVIKETFNCIKKYCSNSGRSSHTLAVKTSEEIYRAREAVSDFFGRGEPEKVCFSTNATYALNIAIKSLITEPCHVLISDIEHNSILRPVNKLKYSVGITYSSFSTDGNLYENIKSSIKSDTRAIVCNLTSNVTGKETSLSVLSRISREYGLLLIVDASQIAGHKEINLTQTPCDVLCAPGHKGLFGIQGCGFMIFGEHIPEESFIEGGSGNESRSLIMPRSLPEHFEAGTLPTPSIVSLRAGIDFINDYGLINVEKKLNSLTRFFKERLEGMRKVELFAAENGIISFRIKNTSSAYIADRLDGFGIYTRSGLHCAPLVHQKLGTLDTGLVRISLSIMNKESDADYLYLALNSIID